MRQPLPRLLKPILPRSKTKPIRTRTVLSRMAKNNTTIVHALLARINRNISQHQHQHIVNADDSAQDPTQDSNDSSDAAMLLFYFACIKDGIAYITPQLKQSISTVFQQSHSIGWKHTEDSVNRQLQQILDVSRYKMLPRPIGSGSGDMTDVIVEECTDSLEQYLKKYVRTASGAGAGAGAGIDFNSLNQNLVKTLNTKIGNEINTTARQARADYIRINQDVLNQINTEIKLGQINVVVDTLEPVEADDAENIGADEDITGKTTTGKSCVELSFKLLWTSALLPTTRPWHGSRHGHTYSQSECDAFYAENGNSCNCHCSQDVIVDAAQVQHISAKMHEQHTAWEHTIKSKTKK